MKRLVVTVFVTALAACTAVVIGAGSVVAASPPVEAAIETLESVGSDPGKLKTFCALNKLLQTAGQDEAGIRDAVAGVGKDFGAAWEVGKGLDEASTDGKEFYAAVDTLAAKCR